MATDKLINHSQGDDIINALDDIATSLGNISYGEQTSSNKVVAMTGYQKASTAESITQADTLNEAVGKLEKKVDDHATDSSRVTSAIASGLYKVAATAQGHIASLSAVTKTDITNLGIPGTDTNTHRPIQVNGTEILGNNTTVLNLKEGSNVSISNSSGTVTIAATDTNTYVSGAEFADNTSTDANNPLKLTLSRSGTVTTAVTGTLPKVSSSSAGVAPKGAAVSSQSQSTKFLREDGTWAKPSYTTNTNTTYTFGSGSTNGAFSVTPSGGSTQTVSIYGLKSAAYTESSAYATSGHTHDVSIAAAASGATANVNLSANTIYTLTAGGKTYNFKTPVDNNSVTGVKGNSESSYRTGQVNITAANIGLGNVGNFKAVSTVASQGLSDTEKSNARANIGAAPASLTVMGFGLDEYGEIWLDLASLPVTVGESFYSLGDFLIPTKVKIAEGEAGVPAGSASYGCNINHIVSLHVDVRTSVDIAVGSEKVIAYVSDPPYGNHYHIYPLMLGFYSGTPIAGIQCYMRGDESCVYVKPLQSAIPNGTHLLINGTYLADNGGIPPLPT